ncbi:sex hormone-binding globulin isoform X3 [Pelodiscus sinensis]|uniref:sex hormone-binding globulin isoform X3 n=1 Tax=Pelodiscus sinensis TaxID=13735 RepID=UPI003F6B0065
MGFLASLLVVLLALGRFSAEAVSDRPITHGDSAKDDPCFQALKGDEGALNIGQHWGNVTPTATIHIDLRQVTSTTSSFEFRTLDPEGVIFFGDMGDHSDWFMLGLRRGRAEIQISNVVTSITVRGGWRLDDGLWHRMNTAMDGCIRHWAWLNQSTTWQEDATLERSPKRCFSTLQPGSFFPGAELASFRPADLASGTTPVNESWALEVELGVRAPRQTGLLLAVATLDQSLALSLLLQPTAVLARLGNATELQLPLPKGPCLDAPLHLRVSPTHLALRLGAHGDSVTSQPPDFQRLRGAWLGQGGRLFIGGLPEEGETPMPKEWGSFRGCLRGIQVQGHLLDLDSALFRSDTIWAHSCPGDHEVEGVGHSTH